MAGRAGIFVKNPQLLFKLVNWWPPYSAAGIRVTRVTDDYRELDVELRMHLWNRNVFGTHYGGSIYSMIDPWYCIMLLQNLGKKDYVVWDKAATTRFRNPGVGTISAKFRLTEERIDQVRLEADREGRAEPTFRVEIFDASGKLVADADKIISVRRKDKMKNRLKSDPTKTEKTSEEANS